MHSVKLKPMVGNSSHGAEPLNLIKPLLGIKDGPARCFLSPVKCRLQEIDKRAAISPAKIHMALLLRCCLV